jgi:hypothetical protein
MGQKILDGPDARRGSQNQSGVAQRSVEQCSAPLASQELVLELVLILVLVQAASCNLTRAWPTSIPMTPLTVCWCGSSRAGIVAVKDTVDNRITVVVTSCDRQDRHDLLIIDTRISFPRYQTFYIHIGLSQPPWLSITDPEQAR